MIRLSAFADEISPDLLEQIAVLKSEGIHALELRGVWHTNVLDLTDAQVALVRKTLTDHQIAVSSIGSPIGKVPIDSLFEDHLRRFERALALAQVFETPYIRIFSFYPPVHGQNDPAPDPASYRDAVLAALRELTARARSAGVTLLHENEKDIYGDTIPRCVDLLRSIDDAHFQAILDPANFIQCGQTPYPDAYAAVHPWLRYVHVKDALLDGSVVAAGHGASRWPDILHDLRDEGYDGYFSLEPHLSSAGKFQGFSGPDLFRTASQAFQTLLRALEWPFA